jgi:hypothetical protein
MIIYAGPFTLGQLPRQNPRPFLKGQERGPQRKSARRQDDRAVDAGECAAAGDNVFHG